MSGTTDVPDDAGARTLEPTMFQRRVERTFVGHLERVGFRTTLEGPESMSFRWFLPRLEHIGFHGRVAT